MRKWFSQLLLLVALVTVPPPQSYVAQTISTVDSIIEQMSLEHKVAQMFMVNLYGAALTDAGRDMLQTWQPGAVVLLKSNVEQSPAEVARLVSSYQQTITGAGGVPLLVAVDQEGGIIQHLSRGFTVWPVPMLMTASADEDLVYRVGEGMAAEMRAVGVNMNLAPVADLYTNLDNPIIGRRSFGSHPERVGETLRAYIGGLQEGAVLATVKHFPGHGDTDEDSHTGLPALNLTRERLDDVELPPFVASIEAGAGAVMVAHIWYPLFDPDEPLPASLSSRIVSGLLRDELAYDGIIMTDAMDMDAIDTVYSPEEAAVQAVIAGHDLLIIGANAGEGIQARAMQAVVDAVRAGQIDEGRIDDSVRRILTAKQRLGVLDWSPVQFDAAAFDALRAENVALVDELFQAGVTVVDADGVVPVDTDQSVGVIFPGTRYGIQRMCDPYHDGIRWLARSGSPGESEIDAAVDLAKQVDRLVVFVDDAYYDATQQALVTALPPEKTIVVALSSPFDWVRFQQVAGYVATYSPLDPAIDAACGVIFGSFPATGSLPIDLSIGAN